MDGHFVPNLSMGPATVEGIRPITNVEIEVHLMVMDPGRFVEPFVKAGADRVIFHIEVAEEPEDLAGSVADAGVSAGVAVKPGTDWTPSYTLLEIVDLVLVMTVEPGFGGQEFIEDTLAKIQAVRESVRESGLAVDIEVDGGIDLHTAPRAQKAGANVFVAGNSIFRSPDPAAAAEQLARALGGLDGRDDSHRR
jgi:ribulose-phosphate 3-epimerase